MTFEKEYEPEEVVINRRKYTYLNKSPERICHDIIPWTMVSDSSGITYTVCVECVKSMGMGCVWDNRWLG